MLLIVPALLLYAFEWSALEKSLHRALYDELGDPAYVGVDGGDLLEIQQMLIAYLRGERSDLAMRARVFDREQQVFNEREIVHMHDVLALFHGGWRAAGCMLAAGGLLLAAGLRGGGWRRRLVEAGNIAQGAWALALIAVAAWALIDFTGLFYRFHGLLFTNDLWLLNPETDLMIRMLPQRYFEKVAAWSAAAMLAGQLLLRLVILLAVRLAPGGKGEV